MRYCNNAFPMLFSEEAKRRLLWATAALPKPWLPGRTFIDYFRHMWE